MNLMNRMMSYDKNKKVIQESCECEECTNSKVETQIIEYPPLTDEEIDKIIKERYDRKDEKTKTFIRKALKVHGDRYDYSNVVYIKSSKKVEIICRVEGHESFPMTPNNHLSGKGCKKCGYIESSKKLKMTFEEFIEKANKIHGEGTYDYSKVEYVDIKTEVIIICPIHDDFSQTPDSHLQGHGCKICGYIKSSEKRKMTKEEFIEKANKIHGEGIYDYSKVVYVNNYTEVTIICSKHGEFSQTPSNHLQSEGCLDCTIERLANLFKFTKEEFIEKANEIHGVGRYDYSKVNYINMNTEVIITCPIHGDFPQKPREHIYDRCGCSKCNKNKGEESVRKFLTENKIEFEEQKTFDGCEYKQKLKFDFYLPQYNLCIESDGCPHYRKVNWNGKMTDEEMKERLKNTQHRDNIKNEYCKKNGISLLRVYNLRAYEEVEKYFQDNKIITI